MGSPEFNILLIFLIIAVFMHIYYHLPADRRSGRHHRSRRHRHKYRNQIDGFESLANAKEDDPDNQLDPIGSQKIGCLLDSLSNMQTKQDSDSIDINSIDVDLDNLINEDQYKQDHQSPPGMETTKQYLQQYVLNGRKYSDSPEPVEASRQEVDDYREKQLHFRDKIFGTSADPFDTVDRMNQITMQGGIQGDGQTIAQVYDRLTACNF